MTLPFADNFVDRGGTGLWVSGLRLLQHISPSDSAAAVTWSVCPLSKFSLSIGKNPSFSAKNQIEVRVVEVRSHPLGENGQVLVIEAASELNYNHPLRFVVTEGEAFLQMIKEHLKYPAPAEGGLQYNGDISFAAALPLGQGQADIGMNRQALGPIPLFAASVSYLFSSFLLCS